MEYMLVQAVTAADSFSGCREIARFPDPDRALGFFRAALHPNPDRARDWVLLDPVGRAVAGLEDVLDETGSSSEGDQHNS